MHEVAKGSSLYTGKSHNSFSSLHLFLMWKISPTNFKITSCSRDWNIHDVLSLSLLPPLYNHFQTRSIRSFPFTLLKIQSPLLLLLQSTSCKVYLYFCLLLPPLCIFFNPIFRHQSSPCVQTTLENLGPLVLRYSSCFRILLSDLHYLSSSCHSVLENFFSASHLYLSISLCRSLSIYLSLSLFIYLTTSLSLSLSL